LKNCQFSFTSVEHFKLVVLNANIDSVWCIP
jgi:hypothetical protein